MKNFTKKAYIYKIEYENKPIYIGSTSDLKLREKDHNKNLINNETKHLYINLRLLGFKEIKLVVIKTIDNYYYKIKKVNKFFEYKYYVEDLYIKHCVKKGLFLLNLRYPCEHDEKGKLLNIQELKIKYLNYPIYYIYNYNKDINHLISPFK